MVTGVSSPPSMTNLRGRMLAATLTPLTASASAPGTTVLIARMAARSGWKSAALRPPAPAPSALALITSGDTACTSDPFPSRRGKGDCTGAVNPRAAVARNLLRRHLVRCRYAARLHHHLDRIFHAVLGVADRGRQILEREG